MNWFPDVIIERVRRLIVRELSFRENPLHGRDRIEAIAFDAHLAGGGELRKVFATGAFRRMHEQRKLRAESREARQAAVT